MTLDEAIAVAATLDALAIVMDTLGPQQITPAVVRRIAEKYKRDAADLAAKEAMNKVLNGEVN